MISKWISPTRYGLIFPLLLLLLFPGGAAAAKEYRLSMLPRYYPERLRAMITPLADYLSRSTGLKITPVLTENFAHYEAEIGKGAIQIGYQNPLVYVNLAKRHRVLATAVKGKGKNRFRGIIITRPDSAIRSLADLKGKRIMIVAKTSAGGYLSQKLTLKAEHIDVDRDCTLEEAAANRQENVIIAVSIGDVDAGFIRESALHKADKYIAPGSVTVMARTAWLPNWAFSVDRSMPEQDREALRMAILHLDDRTLRALGLAGFRPAVDSDYDVIRQVLAK